METKRVQVIVSKRNVQISFFYIVSSESPFFYHLYREISSRTGQPFRRRPRPAPQHSSRHASMLQVPPSRVACAVFICSACSTHVSLIHDWVMSKLSAAAHEFVASIIVARRGKKDTEQRFRARLGCVHLQNFSLQTSIFTYHIKSFILCIEY